MGLAKRCGARRKLTGPALPLRDAAGTWTTGGCLMIRAEAISPNVLKIIPSKKLTEADFEGLAPQVDAIIATLAGPVADRRFRVQWLGKFCGYSSAREFHKESSAESGAACHHRWSRLAALASRRGTDVLAPRSAILQQKPRRRGAEMGRCVLAGLMRTGPCQARQRRQRGSSAGVLGHVSFHCADGGGRRTWRRFYDH